MRILLTVPSLEREFGGPAVKARQLQSSLIDLGHTVRILTVGDAENRQILGLPRLGRFRGTPIPAWVGGLRAAVEDADLVHVLGYRDPPGTAAALVARRAGVPYVHEPVGMHRRRHRSLWLKAVFDAALGPLVVGGAAQIVVTSRLEAEELEADGVESERLVLRPNGVNLCELLPLPERGGLRAQLGIPDAAPLVLALGRITAKKGLTDLIRAIGQLKEVWLLVVGPDQRDGTLSELRRLCRRLPGGGRTVLLPLGLWGRDKAQALRDADAFALPSTSENFGTAAAEAACCALPVVVSEACGVREWLDPRSSRSVPAGHPRQLSSALREILTDPTCRVNARASAPRLRDRLSWERIARRQLRIYEAALERDL